MTNYGTYGFRFQDEYPNDFANIFLLGREQKLSGTIYDWHGLRRKDFGPFSCNYVFQYTLSGFGQLDIEGNSYSVKAGEAFIVEVPGNHRYYLPNNSDGWEYIFITLVGKKAAECWNFMKEQRGPVFKVPPNSKLIQTLLKLHQDTAKQQITDAYYASAKAYEFIMECYRFIKNVETSNKECTLHITKALSFIHTHYNDPITLDEIAAVSGLSKYYFIKQFQNQLNMTPVQYLTKIRIQKAVELLRSTNLSITDIASQVGYENANYFNKVFHKLVGVSAGTFRGNYLILD